jgi:hypothetical protein
LNNLNEINDYCHEDHTHNHSRQNTKPTNKELMVQFANESDLMLKLADTPRMLNMDNARVVNKGPHKAM